MSPWWGILWLVVLLAVNAFFVAAEFAVVTARRSQIEPEAERGNGGARVALWAMEHATLMLATTQLGITVCSLLLLGIAEPAIHDLLAGPLESAGVRGAVAADATSFVIALVVVSFLHVVFGEMVPKNLSFSRPRESVLLLARPLVAIGRVVRPITVALNWLSNGVVRLFGVEPKDGASAAFTLDEVEAIARHSARAGVLATSEVLRGAFEFSGKTAAEIMVPIAKVVRLPHTVTPAEVERAVARYGFSRYVIDDEAGQAVGYLHLKDVLDLEGLPFDSPVPVDRIRPLARVAPGAEIEDVLALLRRRASHLARIVHRGETIGVVFLEDILEELVGEVDDATRRD